MLRKASAGVVGQGLFAPDTESTETEKSFFAQQEDAVLLDLRPGAHLTIASAHCTLDSAAQAMDLVAEVSCNIHKRSYLIEQRAWEYSIELEKKSLLHYQILLQHTLILAPPMQWMRSHSSSKRYLRLARCSPNSRTASA